MPIINVMLASTQTQIKNKKKFHVNNTYLVRIKYLQENKKLLPSAARDILEHVAKKKSGKYAANSVPISEILLDW